MIPLQFLSECPTYARERRKLKLGSLVGSGSEEAKFAALLTSEEMTVTLVTFIQATRRFSQQEQAQNI
jgi:hypothetical protein